MSDAAAMRFKARMNKLSKECGLRPQSVIQNYMFERFLQRLSESSYRENFVIKGGVLISAMVGIRARSTMDVDTTLVDMPLTFKSMRKAFESICAIDVGDDVSLTVLTIDRIRLQIEGYGGIRVRLAAEFHGLKVPFSVDVTAGDAIGLIEYSYTCHFSENSFLSLKAYSLETVLAEKCEAILRRNVVGTRPRDYYDVYLLTRMSEIDMEAFFNALRATCEICGTNSVLHNIEDTLSAIRDSSVQTEYWSRFQREFPYARDIQFADAVEAVRELLGGLE